MLIAVGVGVAVVLVLLSWLSGGQPMPGNQIQTPLLTGADNTADAGDGGGVPWTGTTALQQADDFSFAVVTDRTGGHRPGIFPLAMDKLNLVKPAFVVSVGDLIEGYTDDPEILNTQWKEIGQFVGRLQMPFFYVAGNHDMSNAVMANLWREKFGPSYYHFRYRDTLFLILNSELFGMVHSPSQPLPGPWGLEQQMAWAEQVLAQNADVRWTFVLVHQPLWDREQVHPQWQQMESLLAGRKHTVFAGHEHNYTLHRRNDSNYITLATTGGGSQLRGPLWGEFDHITMVNMGSEGPTIANLELRGIHAKDVRTETTRALTEAMNRAVELIPTTQIREFFSRGRALFKVTNTSDQAFHLRASFTAPEGYQVENSQLSLSLPAGGTQQLGVDIKATTRSLPNIGSMPPLRAEFMWSTDHPEAGEPLEIRVERNWVPEHPFIVRRTSNPMHIDGNMADWKSLRFQAASPVWVSGAGPYGGADDLSFTFDLQADSKNLYILARVRDDSLVSSTARIARHQDMLNIVLDARPEPALSRNYPSLDVAAATGELAQIILPFIALVEPQPDPILGAFGIRPVPGLRKAVRRTPDGYIVEAAIELSLLAKAAGGQMPEKIRFNLVLTDFDEGEHAFTQIAWRTPRYREEASPGSGIFRLP